MIVIDDDNRRPRIETLYMFVSVDVDGNEGIIAYGLAAGHTMMPLITSNPANLPNMRARAAELAAVTSKRIRLVRFTSRVDEDWIEPAKV